MHLFVIFVVTYELNLLKVRIRHFKVLKFVYIHACTFIFI